MKFKMEVDIDNAAFDNPEELSKILRDAASYLPIQFPSPVLDSWKCKDTNGNTVGYFRFMNGSVNQSTR